MLEITVSIVRGVTVVGLRGALVHGEDEYLTQIVEWLQESGERRVALHAAGVTAVDIEGLAALVHCHAALKASGGWLIIKMPSPRLQVALTRSGLDTVLRIVGDLDGVIADAADRVRP